MLKFVIVGIGGALGAICRYGISLIPVKYSFPVLTLVINFLGSTLIGFIIGLSLAANLSANTLLFWKTGVCGGFTTFSAFSAEAWQLFQTVKIWQGGLYVVLSVGLCLAGVAMGQSLGRIMVRQ